MERSQEFFAGHNCKLRDLLEEIVDTDKRIEYGRSDEQPGGFYSHIRIRHMQTVGGRQFCVKQISHGTEGGGFYTKDVDDLLSYADKLVRYVERPSPTSWLKPWCNKCVQKAPSSLLSGGATIPMKSRKHFPWLVL